MDVVEQINKFNEFIEKYYYPQLLENVRNGNNYLEIDFNKLSKYNPILADLLLEQPEETIKAVSVAAEQFDFDKEVANLQILFKNLPDSTNIPLSDISDQLDKFLTFEGYVMKPTDIFLKCKSARFECKSCGAIISVLMLGSEWRNPTKCSCGAKGHFRELNKTLKKFQKLEIVEVMDDVPDKVKQPVKKKVLIEENLTRRELNQVIQPGQRVLIYGHLELEEIKSKFSKRSNEFRTNIVANNIVPIEKSWDAIKLTTTQVKKIKSMAKNTKLLDEFVQSLAPSFEGYELLRKALILQHVGSKRIFDKNGNLEERGIIHILMCGDPSRGKSYLMKRSLKISPLWQWTQGAGLTKVGLVAAVTKDEYGNYTLEVGPLVMAHKGILGIDETEKMEKKDFGILNNAMNDEQTKISKATINQTLKTETSIIMASNPLHKKFIETETVISQLKPIPKDILDRCDIIWAMREKVDKNKIEEKYMARHTNSNTTEQLWSNNEMQLYISYARKLIPIISDDISKYFSNKFNKLTGKTNDETEQSQRLRGNILRFAYAYTKFTCVGQEDKNNFVTMPKEAIDFAFLLIKRSFELLNLIDIKGFAKYEDIEEIPTNKEINKYYLVKGAFKQLSSIYNNQIPYDRLLEHVGKEIGLDEDGLDKEIERLKKVGDIFEPRRGYWGVL